MQRPTEMPWTQAHKNIDKQIESPSCVIAIKNVFRKAYIKHSIQVEDLHTRRRRLVDINMIIASVITDQYRNLPLKTIGNLFDKHHATIIHYKKLYENVLCSIPEYFLLYQELTDLCVYEKYGIIQDVVGKSKIDLKNECLRLMAENRELSTKLEAIKNLANA